MTTELLIGGGGGEESMNGGLGENRHRQKDASESLIDIAVAAPVSSSPTKFAASSSSIRNNNGGRGGGGTHALRVPQAVLHSAPPAPLLRSTLHESEVVPEAGALSEQPELSDMKRINDELASSRRRSQRHDRDSGRHVAFASHSDHIDSEPVTAHSHHNDVGVNPHRAKSNASVVDEEDDDENYTENAPSHSVEGGGERGSDITSIGTASPSAKSDAIKNVGIRSNGLLSPPKGKVSSTSKGATVVGTLATAAETIPKSGVAGNGGFVGKARDFFLRHKMLLIAAVVALVIAGIALFFFVKTQVTEKRRRAEQLALDDLQRRESEQGGNDRALQEVIEQNALLVRQQQETAALLAQYEQQAETLQARTDAQKDQYEAQQNHYDALTAQYAEQQQQLAEYADYIEQMEKYVQAQQHQQQELQQQELQQQEHPANGQQEQSNVLPNEQQPIQQEPTIALDAETTTIIDSSAIHFVNNVVPHTAIMRRPSPIRSQEKKQQGDSFSSSGRAGDNGSTSDGAAGTADAPRIYAVGSEAANASQQSKASTANAMEEQD